jgi:hypothetical protein
MDTAAPPVRPTGLTTTVILVVALAAFEGLSAFGALGMGAIVEVLSEDFGTEGLQNLPPEPAAHLQRMRTLATELATSRLILVMAAAMLPVAIWTVVAALRLNRGKPGSARQFAHAVTGLGAVEALWLLGIIPTLGALKALMNEMLTLSTLETPAGADPAEVFRRMKLFMDGALWGGFAIALGLGVGKVAYCFYVRHYARKPEVLAWAASAGGTIPQ